MADQKARLSVLFRRADCRSCNTRRQCTGNVDGKGRHLLLLPEPLQKIQSEARARQKTPEWKRAYDLRAGAESTVSETVRAHGLRHCRYRGLAKTHVQHVLTAAGTNIVRISQHRPGRNRRSRTPLQQLFQPETARTPRSPTASENWARTSFLAVVDIRFRRSCRFDDQPVSEMIRSAATGDESHS
jgi:hypothetical protein